MFEVLLLSFALSMDAFAVSIGLGVKAKEFNIYLAFKIAFFFGIFQGIMPLFGYLASIGLGSFIEAIDHWIAFILLSIIGIKMIIDSFSQNTEEIISKLTNKILLILAIATSIDAMAAGFSLNLMSISPFLSMFLIGMVTFVFSFIAVYIGVRGGAFLESKAEILGGVVLILIGFKILIEHTLV
ncbi:MAG: manganese efflux pump MntP [Arcobacter sp.]|nr:MAG: manganese efflux pump MntP [Arcobacter sp.]